MKTRAARTCRWRLPCIGLSIAGMLLGSCSSHLAPIIPSIRAPAEDEEARIAREFRREAKKHFKFVTHPEVERYIDRLGQRLLIASGPQAFDYRFFVIEDQQLNAFAVPGGSIYFFSGLLERAKSSAEIAGVLGHEIIHIKGRHMARSSGPDAASVLSLLAMVLLATNGSGGQAAGVVGQAISATRQMAYSRQLELEADTLGARYMAAAGFDPNGALAFLKMLEEERSLNPINIPAYLMTHPVTRERVANMEQVIRSVGDVPASRDEPDPLKKVQLALRLERRDENLMAQYERLAIEHPQDGETLYLLGYGRHLKGQLVEAQSAYERARESLPKHPGLLRDLGRLYAQLGLAEKSRTTLQQSLEVQPKEPLTYIYFGELYETQGDYRSAAGAYLMAHNLAPRWDKPAQLLGTAYAKLDRLSDAYYYLGRSLLLQDEDEKAWTTLEKAAKLAPENSPRRQLITEELNNLRARRR
jgi:predicted Zn-dependent protease